MRSILSAALLFVFLSLHGEMVFPFTDSEISSLIRCRDQLLKVNIGLEKLFSSAVPGFYSAVRKGFFDLGEGDLSDFRAIEVLSDTRLTFHPEQFRNFKRELIKITDAVVIDRFRIKKTEDHRKLHALLREKAGQGSRTVIFSESDSEEFLCLRLPAAVYRKLLELSSPQAVMVYKFRLKGGRVLNRYIRCTLSFFRHLPNDGKSEGILFCDRMNFNFTSIRSGWQENFEFTKKWSFEEKDIRRMQKCDIEIFHGKKAEHVWNCVTKDLKKLRQSAAEGYVPAMFELNKYGSQKRWLCRAALLGSKEAQKKLNWKSGGFSFGIHLINNKFVIWNPDPALPLRKGRVIKAADGLPVRTPLDFSMLLSFMPPGKKVCLQFEDGDEYFFLLRPRL